MPFLLDDYWSNSKLQRLKSLLDCKSLDIISKQGGGNSVVYCINVDGKRVALKSYPPYAPDKRDRLAAELLAYQFFNRHSVQTVPRLIAHCAVDRWLVIDWIEGESLKEYTVSDIEQAIDFIQSIAKLSKLQDAVQMSQAAEACLSLKIIIDQINCRVERLRIHYSQEKELKFFLEHHFSQVFAEACHQATLGYEKNGMNLHELLPRECCALIPADFGFHNIIRDNQARLHFFDFDYFGWDDPVKLLSDILWHPKMQLSDLQKTQFIDGLSHCFGSDSLFLTRFHYNEPLFGLRWVLILLNEFIPEFWKNRQHANVHTNHDEAKITQLQRAKMLLDRVQQATGRSYDFVNP